MIKTKDYTGQKFQMLTAIRLVEVRNKKPFWLFRCDCGKEVIKNLYKVKGCDTFSCGCYRRKRR